LISFQHIFGVYKYIGCDEVFGLIYLIELKLLVHWQGGLGQGKSIEREKN
jgi:hypothetical protein